MYGKKEAALMGEIWTLQKKKLDEVKNADENWWSNTIAEFNEIVHKGESEHIESCLGHHAVAAICDIEDKALNRTYKTELHYMPQDMTIEEFKEYLQTAKRGDSVKVCGVRLEVK